MISAPSKNKMLDPKKSPFPIPEQIIRCSGCGERIDPKKEHVGTCPKCGGTKTTTTVVPRRGAGIICK